MDSNSKHIHQLSLIASEQQRFFKSLSLKLGGRGIPTKTSKWIWKGIHCTLPTSNQKIGRIPGIFLFTCLSSFRTRPLLPNGHKNALTKRRSEECSGSKWVRNLSEGVFLFLCGAREALGAEIVCFLDLMGFVDLMRNTFYKL